MTTRPAKPHMTRLLSYVIASADMYYAETEQRVVFLSYDEQGCFRIGGKMVDEELSTEIDIFEIFLEYALTCRSWAGGEEALYNMQDFGERFGSLACGATQKRSPAVQSSPLAQSHTETHL